METRGTSTGAGVLPVARGLANLMRITWNPFYPYLETRMRNGS